MRKAVLFAIVFPYRFLFPWSALPVPCCSNQVGQIGGGSANAVIAAMAHATPPKPVRPAPATANQKGLRRAGAANLVRRVCVQADKIPNLVPGMKSMRKHLPSVSLAYACAAVGMQFDITIAPSTESGPTKHIGGKPKQIIPILFNPVCRIHFRPQTGTQVLGLGCCIGNMGRRLIEAHKLVFYVVHSVGMFLDGLSNGAFSPVGRKKHAPNPEQITLGTKSTKRRLGGTSTAVK